MSCDFEQILHIMLRHVFLQYHMILLVVLTSFTCQVKMMDEHEDSVCSVSWSAAEAWLFCSLSYDGRVILNHVPSTEKYKILL